MKKIIIGLLTLGTLTTHASMLELNGPMDADLFNSQVNEGKTYFETLRDLFEVGTRPDASEIANFAWSGRCFFRDNPNAPMNGGYILRKKAADVGPIGANLSSYEVLSYSNSSLAPNYYDRLSLEQIYALKQAMTPKDATIKKDSIQADLVGGYRSNLKISNGYLVEQLSAPSAEASYAPALMCYYFIPEINF